MMNECIKSDIFLSTYHLSFLILIYYYYCYYFLIIFQQILDGQSAPYSPFYSASVAK